MNTNAQEVARNEAQDQLKQLRDIGDSIRFIVTGLEVGQNIGAAELDAMTRAFKKLKKLRAEVRESAYNASSRRYRTLIGDELMRERVAMRGSQRRAHEQFLAQVAARVEFSK